MLDIMKAVDEQLQTVIEGTMEDNKKEIVWQFIQKKFFPKWTIIFDLCAAFLRKFNSRSFWSRGAQKLHWQ